MKIQTQLSSFSSAVFRPNLDHILVAAGDTCQAYSDDSRIRTRLRFPIVGVNAPGSMVFPGRAVQPLDCLDGEDTFETFDDGSRCGYITGSGAKQTGPSPLVSREHWGAELDSAVQIATLNSKNLVEGLDLVGRSSPVRIEEGALFRTKGSAWLEVRSLEFEGWATTIPTQAVELICDLLQWTSDRVTILKGEHWTYVQETGRNVVGWRESDLPHSLPPVAAMDAWNVRVSRDSLLQGLRFCHAQDESVSLAFNSETGLLRFLTGTGLFSLPSIEAQGAPNFRVRLVVRELGFVVAGMKSNSIQLCLNSSVLHVREVEDARRGDVPLLGGGMSVRRATRTSEGPTPRGKGKKQ